MIKEKRKRKRRFLFFIRGFLIVMLLIAIAILIILKVFTVENVEIEGNKLYEQKVIEDVVLNDEYSWNSLYVFIKYKFVDTQDVPFIDTMDISLAGPHTLKIKVYEKGMMGYLYIPGINENAYFDKDGIVVETSSDVIEKVPKIEGIDCEKVVLYEKLPIDSAELRDILTLTQALKRKKLVPDSIVYGGTNEPELKYDKVSVLVGDTSLLTLKVDRLEAIMPSIKDMNGTLHLESWTEENTNIVFDKNT